MITIKLPYKTSDKFYEELKELRRQQSVIVRYSYNRYLENLKQKDIRLKCKDLKNIDLGSWLIQCGIMRANQLVNRFKGKTIIFGSKLRFKQLITNRITKEEYKEKRLLPLTIQGEKNYYGNRHFNLRVIDGNFIEFNPNRKKSYILTLPNLKANYRRLLYQLEEQANLKQATYSIELTKEHICISFELCSQIVKHIETRVMGIDLNPDNIGISISDWVDNKQVILTTKYYDLSEIINKTLSLNEVSNFLTSKYLNNKLISETYEISKSIANLAKHYQCKTVIVEELKFKDKLNSKVANRKCYNLWKRNDFIKNLEKRLLINNISLIAVHPAYTSFIGNLQYDYSDSVNASLEIARRGYESKILRNKDKFYPNIVVKHQWKEMVTTVSSWKELFLEIKNLKMQYRVQLEEVISKSCFSLSSNQSMIKVYTLYRERS